MIIGKNGREGDTFLHVDGLLLEVGCGDWRGGFPRLHPGQVWGKSPAMIELSSLGVGSGTIFPSFMQCPAGWSRTRVGFHYGIVTLDLTFLLSFFFPPSNPTNRSKLDLRTASLPYRAWLAVLDSSLLKYLFSPSPDLDEVSAPPPNCHHPINVTD